MNRTIQVVLQANVTGFAAGMGTASAAVKQFGNEANSMATRTDSASKATLQTVGRLSLAVGTGLAAALALSIRSAVDFEVQMRNVSSISDYARENFDKVSASVVDMSRQMPQSASVLAKGLYDIASSGFDGAEGMNVLRASAKAASAGLTDTATAAKGITAVLNAYGLSGFEASHVSDVLFQTVKLGVVTFEELTSKIGDYIGSARAANLTIEDTQAFLAAMTLSGVSAAEAGTSLNRVIQAFIDPSTEMTAALKELGFETGAEALAAEGLHGIFAKLQGKYGDNITALHGLFPEMQALRGALGATAADGTLLADTFGHFDNKLEALGATQAAYDEQMKSTGAQWDLAKNNITAMAIELSDVLLPAITDLLGFFADMASGLGDMPKPLQLVVVGMGLLATVVTLAGGAFLLMAPNIAAAKVAMATFRVEHELLAGTMSKLPLAVGVVGVAVGMLTLAYSQNAGEKRALEAASKTLTEAMVAEAKGTKGAADALLEDAVVSSHLIPLVRELGVSLDTVTAAVKGDEAALKALQKQAGEYGSDSWKLAWIVEVMAGRWKASTIATEEQLKAEQLLHPVTAETGAHLDALAAKFGIAEGATEASTEKFGEMADEVGLTVVSLFRLSRGVEATAQAIVRAVTSAADATQSSFSSSFDVVSKFSRSSWESMSGDAEDGSDSISSSVDRVADAEQNLIYTQERLADSAAKAYASMEEDAQRAADGILAAEERLADSKRELIELQERQAESSKSEEERLASDVERANDKVLTSEERLFDSRQSLADLQERQSQKDELTLSDRQAMERATRSVTRAEEDLAKAQAGQADAQARQSAGAQQSVSERQQLERAERNIVAATKDVDKAQQEAADAQARLAEGVKMSISDHQELERAQRAVIEAQTGMVTSSGSAKVAVGTMAEEVEKFFTTSISEANAFMANIHEAIDRGLDPRYVSELLQQGPREAGPFLEIILSDHSGRMISMANEFKDVTGAINEEAVLMARLTQLAVSSGSDQMVYDLKTAMRITQVEAASGGRLTAEALSRELGIGLDRVQDIIDEFGIKVPKGLGKAGLDAKTAFGLGMLGLPAETLVTAQQTSSALTDTVGTLPQWMNTAGEMTKNEWISKLTTAVGMTATQAEAWANALVGGLNPILTGIGSQPIVVHGGKELGADRRGIMLAAGGIVERHDPQVAVGGPVRIWNEPELPWEGYVSGDPSKKGRSVAVMHELAKRLGMEVVERYAGGIDEFGLTMPPSLSSTYGDMLGLTADAGTGHTYEAARAWMAARGMAGGRVGSGAPSGPAPPGTVTDWVRVSANIVGVGESWVAPGYRRAMYESSGNPLAENRWDSNWEAGIPSRGLWQTIQPTFDHYMLPGHGDIWNPIDNGIAAMRYILDVYGSIFAIDPPTSGYRAGGIIDYALMDRGGTLKPGLTLVENRTGRNEMVAGPGQSVVNVANTGEMSSATSHTGVQGSASNTMNVTSVSGAAGANGTTYGRPAGLDMGVGSASTSVDNSTSISFSMPINIDQRIAAGVDAGAMRTAVRAAVGTAQDEMLRQLLALLRMHGRGRTGR